MLLANIDLAMSNAQQKAANANQGGLFDMMEDAIEPVQLADAPEWSESEKLAEEKQVLGFYFPATLLARLPPKCANLPRCASTSSSPQEHVRVAGFVTAVRTMMGRRGKIAFATVEDQNGQAEVMVSGQVLEEAAGRLKADRVLIMECKISRDDYSGGDALRIMANSVLDLSTARERFARSVRLSLAPHHDIRALAELIESSRQEGSRIPLQLSYGNAAASGDPPPQPLEHQPQRRYAFTASKPFWARARFKWAGKQKGRLKIFSDGLFQSSPDKFPNIRLDTPFQARVLRELELRLFAQLQLGLIIFEQHKHRGR